MTGYNRLGKALKARVPDINGGQMPAWGKKKAIASYQPEM
jgi:hypothetical protein